MHAHTPRRLDPVTRPSLALSSPDTSHTTKQTVSVTQRAPTALYLASNGDFAVGPLYTAR